MRCSVVHSLSTAYLDGELDDARSSGLRGHLRTCETCAARLADEQELRRAASELSSASNVDLEPPAHLWQAISEQVAAEEIADSAVAPWRLRLRSAFGSLSPYRAQLAAFAVLVVVVGALVAKQQDGKQVVLIGSAGELIDVAPVFAPSVDVPNETYREQALREIRRSDERYLSSITELRTLATEDRGSWSATKQRRYDDAVRAFDAKADKLRLSMAQGDDQQLAAHDPRSRNVLYALYRKHIRFLEDVVFEQLSALGGTR